MSVPHPKRQGNLVNSSVKVWRWVLRMKKKSVVKSSRNISNAALESIDLSAVSARMREVMGF